MRLDALGRSDDLDSTWLLEHLLAAFVGHESHLDDRSLVGRVHNFAPQRTIDQEGPVAFASILGLLVDLDPGSLGMAVKPSMSSGA
jgi:hypothetical protein